MPAAPAKRKPGRPKGSKNSLTLMKEAELTKALSTATGHMVEHLPRLIEKLVQKADEGDMVAMKMILDRIIPTRKAVEHINNTEAPRLTINVSTGAGRFGEVVEGEVINDNS